MNIKKDKLIEDYETVREVFELSVFNTNADIENFKINGSNVCINKNDDGSKEILVLGGYEKLSGDCISILNIIQEKFTQVSKQLNNGIKEISIEDGNVKIERYKNRFFDFAVSTEYLCKRLDKKNTKRNRSVVKDKCSDLATFMMTHGLICNGGRNKEITPQNINSEIRKSHIKSNIMYEFFNYYSRGLTKDKKYVTFCFGYRFINMLFLKNSISMHITKRSLMNGKNANAQLVQYAQNRYTMRNNVINGTNNIMRIETIFKKSNIGIDELYMYDLRTVKQKLSRIMKDLLFKIDNKYPTKWKYREAYKTHEELINGSVEYQITSLDYVNDIQKRISCQIKNI